MAEIIKTDNLHIPELIAYSECSERTLLNKDKPSDGLFIAESPKVIRRALDAGYEPVSMLADVREIDKEAGKIISDIGDIKVYAAEESLLTELTGFKLTRGVLCAMKRKPLPDIAQVCKEANQIAVIENVMNPTNVGAIIRSAAALHSDAVLLTPECSDPLYRRAIRVSMGTVFQIPWTITDENWKEYLRSAGYTLIALALTDKSVDISDPRIKNCEKVAVILGSEGEGLKPETLDFADFNVKIPMSHGVDSLNVAAASAVAFWEIYENRKK
ncbi:MAG: RNA methyltransferase [Clostridia bacterium]|nr:RNA methyltransferase [Clostridia bacterium]